MLNIIPESNNSVLWADFGNIKKEEDSGIYRKPWLDTSRLKTGA